MTITTQDVVRFLEKFTPNSQPKSETDIENPNYSIYATARFWFPHQVLCLLAEIKTIEVHTFRTCIALNSLQLTMNSILAKGDSQPSGKSDFCDFIINHFPIPHSKLIYLKNLNEKLSKAIESGALPHQKEMINKINETLLCPLNVISWLKAEKITVPLKLLEALAHRDKVDMLYLPKIFPDEINPYGKWTSLRMDYNLSKPNYPVSGIPGFAFTYSPEKRALDEKNENKTESHELDKSILTARAKEIYNNALRVRKLCVESYLKNRFDESAIDYNNLIDRLGTVKEEEFKIYNKAGPWPKMTEHCCRAIGSVIRHFNKEILIRDLEQDSFMIEHGKKNKRISSSTFRKWMHAEGIHDRPSLQKKV